MMCNFCLAVELAAGGIETRRLHADLPNRPSSLTAEGQAEFLAWVLSQLGYERSNVRHRGNEFVAALRVFVTEAECKREYDKLVELTNGKPGQGPVPAATPTTDVLDSAAPNYFALGKGTMGKTKSAVWSGLVAEPDGRRWWVAINGPTATPSPFASVQPPEVIPIPQMLVGFPTENEQQRVARLLMSAPIGVVHKLVRDFDRRHDLTIIRPSNPQPFTRGSTTWIQKGRNHEQTQ